MSEHGERIAKIFDERAREAGDEAVRCRMPRSLVQTGIQYAYQRAAEIARETPEPSQWVPVAERLPDEEDAYLVMVGGYHAIGIWMAGRWSVETATWASPSHWMPLADSPGE